jgi:hypothetical protein
VTDWRPLLEFTQGNPLTLTIPGTATVRVCLAVAKQRYPSA